MIAFAGGCVYTYARELPGRHKALTVDGQFAHYVVEPWYVWFGRNQRVTTSQCLNTITLSPCGNRSEGPMINGGSFNYAGTYGMVAEYERLHRHAIEILPVPSTATPVVERALRDEIAKFWNADCCFTAPTGYQSNILAMTAILDHSWCVIMDQKSHNSILTAAYIAHAGVRMRFKHNNMQDLERLLQQVTGQYDNILVVVEGLYR